MPLTSRPSEANERRTERRHGADKAARAEAKAVVDRWNEQFAASRLWPSTIRAALLADMPLLDGRYSTAFMRPRESASCDSIYQLKGARWSTCSMVTFD